MTMSRSSPAFWRLIDDGERVRALLEGSCYYDATFAEWEHGRRFIAAALHRGGTILDIGCGNGFLLRCLQEWAPHTLEPYGIDTDQVRLGEARALFPDRIDHFAACDAAAFVEDRCAAETATFPLRFDLVYWNVWDNARFAERAHRRILDGLLARLAAGGRLILGFYAPSTAQNLDRVDELATFGYVVDGVTTDSGRDEVAVWFDRPAP